MRKLLKKIAFPVLNRWYQKKTNKVSYYSKHGIQLKINPGVFHPGIFLSTNIFIDFLSSRELANKTFLELGAGSGMISFYAAKHKGIVTASDINKNALEALKENSIANQLPINIVESNLFENLSPNDFDLIIINPPYYSQNPKNEKEQAFFCGENFEYFKGLFLQLKQNWTIESGIFMILSEDCNLTTIKQIAKQSHLNFNLIHEAKKRGEKNYIFQIKRLK